MSETASSRPTVCPPGRPKKELPQYIANGLHGILHNPPDLAAQRLLLFEQAQPITMPMEEFAAYWPYVSNIWKYVNKRTRKDDGTLVEYYECRLFAPTSLPKKIAVPDAPMRSSRDGGKCRCTMKVETPKNGEKRLIRTSKDGHSHNLDHADYTKINDGLKDLCLRQIHEYIEPAQILSNLQAAGRLEGHQPLVDAGGKYLKRQTINNWTTQFRKNNPDHRVTGHNDNWRLQFDEAVRFLDRNNWLTEAMEADADSKKKKAKIGDGQKSHSIVFAKEHRLDSLRSRGYLSLMDSTHKTNYLGWYLYTILIRDEHDSGIPCAHILTDGEDSQILAAGLRMIKQWCNLGRAQSKHWTPQYFLTDDSVAEQLAVQKAFRGIHEGELDVKHILCQVHSDRTLRKRVPVREIQDEIRAALYRRTSEVGALQHIDRALALAKAYMKEKDPEYLDPWEKKRLMFQAEARCQNGLPKKDSVAVSLPSSALATKCASPSGIEKRGVKRPRDSSRKDKLKQVKVRYEKLGSTSVPRC